MCRCKHLLYKQAEGEPGKEASRPMLEYISVYRRGCAHAIKNHNFPVDVNLLQPIYFNLVVHIHKVK